MEEALKPVLEFRKYRVFDSSAVSSVADLDRFGPDPDPTSENRPDPDPGLNRIRIQIYLSKMYLVVPKV